MTIHPYPAAFFAGRSSATKMWADAATLADLMRRDAQTTFTIGHAVSAAEQHTVTTADREQVKDWTDAATLADTVPAPSGSGTLSISEAVTATEQHTVTTADREQFKDWTDAAALADTVPAPSGSGTLSISEAVTATEQHTVTTESREQVRDWADSASLADTMAKTGEVGAKVLSESVTAAESHTRTVTVNAPNTPTVTSWASDGVDSIDLAWNPVAGASAYDVQVLRAGNSVPTTYSGVTSPFAFTGGLAFLQYRARVRARNAAGSSAYSAYTSLETFPF